MPRFVSVCVLTALQISRQVAAHEGSVFCMCEMRSGSLLTGGGKDRKIILWDHELRAERDIEVPLGSLFAPQKCQEVTHHNPQVSEMKELSRLRFSAGSGSVWNHQGNS